MAQWIMRTHDLAVGTRLMEELNMPRSVAAILHSRGIRNAADARVFFQPRIEDLHDPFSMHDMQNAIARLLVARKRKEKILLFGDYDVDGVTATAAMGKILEAMGLAYAVYHPHRSTEGYGFNRNGVRVAHKNGCTLIITLDCGTENSEVVTDAGRSGIDVIVIDHHLQKGRPAPAVALINPKKECCPYPYEDLSTAGLALKFARALVESATLELPWDELLQLAALATIADVAPLKDENRILTILGLAALNRSPLTGITALRHAARLHQPTLTAGNLAFQVAPRINAIGRLYSAAPATQLLLERRYAHCRPLADKLNAANSTRQTIEKTILNEALEEIEGNNSLRNASVIVVAKEGWHRGVVGIVAARLVETFYRPAIVIALEGKMGFGSGRSIPEFDLFHALSRCADAFTSFGGHKYAAGLSLPSEGIDRFRTHVNSIARELLPVGKLEPTLTVDVELNVNELTFPFVKLIEKLAPFGRGNPRPVMVSRNVHLARTPRAIGKNRNHVKMAICPANSPGPVLDCVGWRMAPELLNITGNLFDIAYVPQLNEWKGLNRIQLVIKDIKAVS